MANSQLRKHHAERPHGLATVEPLVVYPVPRRYRRDSDQVERRGGVTPGMLIIKRIFDLVASALLILLLSPLFLLLMALVAFDSHGPVFYSDKRIGIHGRAFRIFKFRTMIRDAHTQRVRLINENGKGSRRILFKHKRDPRVTPLGRFLRKYSLDELPQLFNVLRGEMSLIGPRPFLHEDFEHEDTETPLHRQWTRERHRLWPGLTGLWQVSGRNDLSFEDSMHLDLHYVMYWSLWKDIVILCKTIPAIFACRGAY